MGDDSVITKFWKTNNTRKRPDINEKVLFRKTLDATDFSNVLNNWSFFEKWAVYGAGFVAVAAGACSAALLGRFLRAEFTLANKAGLTLYGVVAGCGASNLIAHVSFVSVPMISSTKVCPTCLQLRQFCITSLTSFVFPSVVLPFGFGVMAVGKFGGGVNSAAYMKYLFKITSSVLWRRLPVLLPVAVGVSSLGVYLEHVYVAKILDQLAKIDDPDVYEYLLTERQGWGDKMYFDALYYIKNGLGFTTDAPKYSK